MNVQANFV